MAAKCFRACIFAHLEVLSNAGAAHNTDCLGAHSAGLLLRRRRNQRFLQMVEQRLLMASDHNIDALWINNPQAHRIKADLRFAQQNVVDQVGKHQTVNARGNPQTQALQQHIDRVGVQIRGSFDHGVEHFVLCAAGQDPQRFPFLHPHGIADFFDQLHLFLYRLM